MNAIDFLSRRINYERSLSMPSSEEAFKLDRMRELLHRLGDPQNQLRIVHIAGTKGKGSTAAMTAAMLSAAGYRTGLFTSPHLERVEERIAVDGQPCCSDELAELVGLVRPAVEAMDRDAAEAAPPQLGPTYFEIITATALCHFAQRKADAVVLEVGLGGRLDSTNVCTPCVSVITSISLDHVKQLGGTLAAIAAEKAGIIKPGIPVISGVTGEEPRAVVRRVAKQCGCRLVELGVDFDYTYHPPRHLEEAASSSTLDTSDFRQIELSLLGRHQAANAALAVATVEELRRTGLTIPDDAIRKGLREVTWPARVEVVARRPAVVLDAAHNAASIAALVEVLAESFSVRQRFLVFGTTQEKDLRGMLRHLSGQFDHVIFTRYQENPRGVPPEELQAMADELADDRASPRPTSGSRQGVREAGIADTRVAATPADAWAAIHRMATPNDLVCITGSFFLATEMRRQIVARPLRCME
jgi:dihydrofolate synthase / folylpolyglutamate synthase